MKSSSRCSTPASRCRKSSKQKGIRRSTNQSSSSFAARLLAANPKIVADVKGGKLQAAANLIGQAKKRNPNVNPGRVREIFVELIEGM